MDKFLESIETRYNGKLDFCQEAGDIALKCDVSYYSNKGTGQFWEIGLKTLADKKISTCLVLGVGTASILPIIKKLWPNAKITGVDVDGELIATAKKYVDFTGMDLVIQDAYDYCFNTSEKYDLIAYDIFVRKHMPVQFASKKFASRLLEMLNPAGKIVVNQPTDDFDGLTQFFPKGERIDAVTNLIYIYG